MQTPALVKPLYNKPQSSVSSSLLESLPKRRSLRAFSRFKGRSFLTGTEFSTEELQALIEVAGALKEERKAGKTHRHLEGMHLALLFEKASLRTRFSFTVAMNELGGHIIEAVSANRKSEEPEDLAGVLNGYVHGVMLRTHEHSTLERMMKTTKIPVINGLSDTHHPCQALADVLTMKERFKRTKGLTLCYVGDGNNVLHSLLLLCPMFGINVNFSCPKGYGPSIDVLAEANLLAVKNNATIRAFDEPVQAAKGAHALYTDVWVSMGFENEESAQREAAFQGYQLDADLYRVAASGAIIMHCMPMVRGKEISAEMADHPNSVLFEQSENRLHVQKALLWGTMGNA